MTETIGEAHDRGWRLTARCAYGNREGLKSIRRCSWSYELDLPTLVATRGRDVPMGCWPVDFVVPDVAREPGLSCSPRLQTVTGGEGAA